MKLKYTTKLFIVVNAIILTFRTLQVLLLTEPNTGFLMDDYIVVNIIGAVLVVACLVALFSNASMAVRQPEKINCCGVASSAVASLSAVLYLASGVLAWMTSQFGFGVLFATSVLAGIMCIAMAVSAVKQKPLSKALFLLPLPYWMCVLIISYLYYTERPLRARTVYETFAVCFVILFTVCFGKAVSGVNAEKNFRRIYPLGLVASSLCILCVVPEGIAWIVGMSEKVTASPVMPLTLAAGAVFTGFFTINTFKKSNTVHPKDKQKIEE